MGRWDITVSKIVLDHEAQAFFAVIPAGMDVRSRRENLMLWMLINTGMRVSELCGLRVKDMPKYLGCNAVCVYKGKRNKSRDIPVSESFAAEIMDYIDLVRPATVPKCYKKHGRDGWMFYCKGKKLTRDQVYYLVRRVAKKAGIAKPITPHMWRHRFATRALDKNGQNLYPVKGWLGHASLAATEKYLHISEILTRGAGEMLDQRCQRVKAI